MKLMTLTAVALAGLVAPPRRSRRSPGPTTRTSRSAPEASQRLAGAVVESGRYVGGDTQYRSGDVFRIEVRDQRVQYLRNGELIYASQKAVVYPLVLDVSLGSMDSTIRNARIATRETAAVASDWGGFRQQTGWRAEFSAGAAPAEAEAVGTSGQIITVNSS